jgi:hypothetical protein
LQPVEKVLAELTRENMDETVCHFALRDRQVK